MKLLYIITVLSVLLGSIFTMDQTQSKTQDRIKHDTNLQDLNEANKVSLFGYECKGSVKTSFIRLKWAWSGEWRCPDLTSIVGYSANYNSKKGALENALSDFMSKFIQAQTTQLENLKSTSNHAKSSTSHKPAKLN